MKKFLFLFVAILLVSSVQVWSAETSAEKTAKQYVDHKPFAKMKLENCVECHRRLGVAQNHNTIWNHRLVAEKKPNNCKACHQLSFCLDCHTGGGLTQDLQVSNFGVDYTPRSHRTDFIEIHPIKAMDDPKSCYRCHDARRFCDECHNKFPRPTLNLISHEQGFSDIQITSVGPKHSTFQPSQCPTCHPNSVLPKNVWSEGHAQEARTNLQSCETCHPNGDVCIKCHSARTGLMVNPHPRGWSGILGPGGKILHANGFAGRLQSAADNRTCIKCH